MKRHIFTLAISVFVAGPAIAETPNHDVFGLWLSAAGDGHIEVVDCGDGTPCGSLAWVDPASTTSGLDSRNPDPEKRARSLIGVPIVWNYTKSKTRWTDGKIYNPEDGKTFRSTLKKRADGTLEVRGCLGPICRTNIWTPVEKTEAGQGTNG